MNMDKMSNLRYNYINNPNSLSGLISRDIHGDRAFDPEIAKYQKDLNSHKRVSGHIPLKN
jgi:hypothetical protein